MSSLENLSIHQLKKKVGEKHKKSCPPYSKWTKQQLIDYLSGIREYSTTESSVVKINKRPKNMEKVADDFMNKYGHLAKKSNSRKSQAPLGWSPAKSEPSYLDDIVFDKKRTQKRKRHKQPSDWSPAKSEPGFFENIVDQFGNLISPPKQKTKKKPHGFRSSSIGNYKKSYKNLIRLTKPQLQRMTKKKGLNTYGPKAQLAQRIFHGENSSVQGTNVENDNVSENLKKSKKQMLRLSKKELQKMAIKKNVNGEGVKIDIINRIKGEGTIGSSSAQITNSSSS